jgi:hypothetical protein
MMKQTFILAVAGLLAISCESFDGPPDPSIEGAVAGVLPDPASPLSVRFSKPIELATLKAKVVPLSVDDEGNLPDERGEQSTELKPLYEYVGDPNAPDEFFGKSELSADRTLFLIKPSARFPVGQKLALLVEPGLRQNGDGRTINRRVRIPFAYDFKCSGKGTKLLTSGVYFFLLNVEAPIGTQIQLYGNLDVDPATGLFRGQFTNADRIRDLSRCPGLGCKAEDACQTLPELKCVQPSERALNVDVFPDFEPNPTPPTGYGVTVRGCAEDLDETTVAFATAPANLVVQQPAVTVRALTVVASFKKEGDSLRATGNGNADEILLGSNPLGRATGTVTSRSLRDGEIPKNVPKAPAE